MLLHTEEEGHAVMAVMKIFKTVGGQMSQKLRQASVLHKVSGDIVQVLREDESTMSRCEVSVWDVSPAGQTSSDNG